MHQIQVQVANGSANERLQAEAGDVLLQILLDAGIAIRHDCGGVCACATCHVYVLIGVEAIEGAPRRETHFLKKAIGPSANSRLSCQCVLKGSGGSIHISIPDQTAIPNRSNNLAS